MRAPLTPTLAAPGSACFGGSNGTATFAEHRQEEGQAALGALPPLSDVPGRLRYGYRLWQARRERRGALAAVLRQRVQRAGLSGMAAVAVLNSCTTLVRRDLTRNQLSASAHTSTALAV